MKHILISAALAKELQVAKTYFKQYKTWDCKISFLETWLWIHKSIMNLTKELNSTSYDFIVNFWVCWYKEAEDTPLIQIIRSVHAAQNKEILIPVFFQFAPLKSIICSDTIVYTSSLLWDENYVDMESYGIELVCEEFKIPRIILKVPVDKIGEETKYFNIPHAIKLLDTSIDFQKLILSISQHLESLPKKENLEVYLSHYTLTFSEKIIMQKYIAAYAALNGKFEDFFHQNKTKKKHEFLKILSTTISQYHLDTHQW